MTPKISTLTQTIILILGAVVWYWLIPLARFLGDGVSIGSFYIPDILSVYAHAFCWIAILVWPVASIYFAIGIMTEFTAFRIVDVVAVVAGFSPAILAGLRMAGVLHH